ncbi:MAG: hypothetical protein A3C62_01010 [Candidatus Zambryskibacteria bacterium RIFCSPHIGHO2_02_FULL_39_16]|uniref:Type II secretion system protein J n=1 Tax=Candidatus Zambryskibacteria bacterium RIFCSPLOWO2_02_FULL_39_14 TaxID=1802769 RepID=A0A1G2UJ45_9BACT|nr:MAG: hypothetical protein UT62_C0017G0004 [Parcubacteria group bacterium GW2011_GWC1_39_8]OHA95780.1 MAG: hypothetical protein A3C62_01010 [Candidatus Zambryskibacteria bacterium RIFCSPHIGHO2_02_FULL_39_16]OHB09438.1 MAG: hypothetical protein A3I86_00590 [Candidatus Zambryskibacteria bacterium RIFCSPLOWO2_02_FULL_39_14]
MKNTGFSIIEFIFAVVIASIIGFVITTFAKDILSLNSSAQSSMTAMLEGRKILSVMVTELRSTIPSALGSYPIESVATSTVVFFADVNSDDVADRVRYFLDPVTLSVKRGVILASGSPPAYTEQESFSTLITDISNGASTPLFDYYDGNYTGSSLPLSMPVNILDVRLVKITIKIERDPNRAPELTTLTSQAALRNLKDNI